MGHSLSKKEKVIPKILAKPIEITATSDVFNGVWSKLPIDTVNYIFSFLSVRELYQTILVSKKWNVLIWNNCSELVFSKEFHNVHNFRDENLEDRSKFLCICNFNKNLNCYNDLGIF